MSKILTKEELKTALRDIRLSTNRTDEVIRSDAKLRELLERALTFEWGHDSVLRKEIEEALK